MRLTSFSLPTGTPRPGLVVGDEIVDLSDPATGLPATMADLLALGPGALEGVRAARTGRAARYPMSTVRRHAPVPQPPAILAIGMNYRAHVAEMGLEPPEWQYWFNKQRTAIAGPGDPIVLPSVSDMVDYEGELAMVIGRRCQHVPAARAREVIAGYTVINDVSARDWQWRTPTFTMGKSFDTHAPCGPEMVTGDELGDPGALGIRTWVNDELRQDSSTDDMIFDCARHDRVPDHGVPARTGHRHRHGDTRRGRRRAPAPSFPGPRGHRPHRHRRDRRAVESRPARRTTRAGRPRLR